MPELVIHSFVGERLAAMAKHRNGSYILQAFIGSLHIPHKKKNKLVSLLKVGGRQTAMSTSGLC